MNFRKLCLFILIILLGYGLRMFDLQHIPGGLHFDEARYLIRSWRVGEGYGLPLWFETSPEPFDAFVRGMFQKFAGYTPFTGRVYSVYLNVLGIAATIGAARALFWQHPRREQMAMLAGITFAVLPASVILSRYIYRIHWIAPASMLAIMLLMWGWHTHKRRYFILSGIFTGITAMTYLAGLIFPVGMVIYSMFDAAIRRGVLQRHIKKSTGQAQVFVMACLVTMLPWIYLYIRIPNWLNPRVDAIRYEPDLGDPLSILEHGWSALRPIYQSDIWFLMAPSFNTFTTPYLNPILLILCVIGVGMSMWQWRQRGALLPIMAALTLIIPALMTVTPYETIRLIGLFAPLGLLVAAGWGTLRLPASYGLGLLTALTIFSSYYTYTRVHYHFTEEPRLFSEEPYAPTSMDSFHLLLQMELMQHLITSDEPIYFPLEYLEHITTVAWLRPKYFPTVRAYQGEPLPEGTVILPDKRIIHDFPPLNRPTGYALILPKQREMVILPPLQNLVEFQEAVIKNGTPLSSHDGWTIAYQQPITDKDNPFASAEYRSFPADYEPLAVYDNHLELVEMDVPPQVQAGTWVPVTLYWRTRHAKHQDYYLNLQLWTPQQVGIGNQDDMFDGLLRWFYPTTMWQTGEVIPEVRWVWVNEDVEPTGAYFAIALRTYPTPTLPDYTNRPDTIKLGEFLMAARTVIPFEPFPPPNDNALEVNANLDDQILLSHVELSQTIESLQTGDTLTVNLYWEAIAPPLDNHIVFVHLLDEQGEIVTQRDAQPLDGRYPTTTWTQGVKLTTTYQLTVPENAQQPLQLAIGMYHTLTFDRLPMTINGEDAPDNRLVLP